MFWNLPLIHTPLYLTCSCADPSAAQWAKEKQRLSAGSNQETWRVTDIDGRLVVDVVRQAIAVSIRGCSQPLLDGCGRGGVCHVEHPHPAAAQPTQVHACLGLCKGPEPAG